MRDLIIQVDRAAADVRNTNVRLKKTLTEVIDVINCTVLLSAEICKFTLNFNFCFLYR